MRSTLTLTLLILLSKNLSIAQPYTIFVDTIQEQLGERNSGHSNLWIEDCENDENPGGSTGSIVNINGVDYDCPCSTCTAIMVEQPNGSQCAEYELICWEVGHEFYGESVETIQGEKDMCKCLNTAGADCIEVRFCPSPGNECDPVDLVPIVGSPFDPNCNDIDLPVCKDCLCENVNGLVGNPLDQRVLNNNPALGHYVLDYPYTDKENRAFSVSVYPNPFKSTFTTIVETSHTGYFSFKIMDSLGQTILRKEIYSKKGKIKLL